MRLSGKTAGPSGNPRPDASRLLSTEGPFRWSDEREVLEVKVRQRLADLSGRVASDLGAVGVERVDEGGDDVTAFGEVDHLHLVLDLPSGGRVGRGVRLLVEAHVAGQAPVRLVE